MQNQATFQPALLESSLNLVTSLNRFTSKPCLLEAREGDPLPHSQLAFLRLSPHSEEVKGGFGMKNKEIQFEVIGLCCFKRGIYTVGVSEALKSPQLPTEASCCDPHPILFL